MPVFGPTRAALAAAAARGAQILPSLRLVLTAEALTAPPPPCAVELNAELEVLCAAAQELAARRAGWLYFCPAQSPLAVRLPRRLLQSTVLTFLRGVLRSRGQGVVRVVSQPGAAVIVLQGSAPADARRFARTAAPVRALCDGGRWWCGGGAAGALPHPAPAGAAHAGRAGAGPLQRRAGISGRLLCGGCAIKISPRFSRELLGASGTPRPYGGKL